MKKLKKVFAIAGVVILLGMYLLTFISAMFAEPGTHKLFLGSLAATIIVPVVIYAYTLIYKMVYREESQDNGGTKSKKAFDEAIK